MGEEPESAEREHGGLREIEESIARHNRRGDESTTPLKSKVRLIGNGRI